MKLQSIEELHNLFLGSTGICTDTRKISKDVLFVALVGENFDGNIFVLEALAQGAKYALVSDEKYATHDSCILVDDTLIILQELSSYHRDYIDIPILALTGSNGKTTTKELCAHVLESKFQLKYTPGNLNNHIGVPLTLLSFDKSINFGIVEMGANHLYEIKRLCEIAKPNFGLITNIGKAHIGEFGGAENIKKAKLEMYDYISANEGVFFYNQDYPDLKNNVQSYKNSIGYSSTLAKGINITIHSTDPFIKYSLGDSVEATLELGGLHNVENVKAAIAVALYFNIQVEELINQLSSFKAPSNRSQWMNTEENELFMDAYNANPSSVEMAIEYFRSLTDKDTLVIIGDMLELGRYSNEEHLAVYTKLVSCELDFYLIGKNFLGSCPDDNRIFSTKELMEEKLIHDKPTGKAILLKASRSMELETLQKLL
ncbi:UDP-N-acetylmuramoyl-tripeptide--D-alanyl-D-alanine ligase [Saprospiraceae bacterium]|nr:UDP-N-acetylmuramoyl-tripeptide--D-alanyl-D-alanine ligase [Saprospiraceae bacterium]